MTSTPSRIVHLSICVRLPFSSSLSSPKACSRASQQSPPLKVRAGDGTLPCILPKRPIRPRSATSSASPLATTSRKTFRSTPSRPRTGSRQRSRTSSRSRPGALSCMASTIGRGLRPTSSASDQAALVAPAIMAPRGCLLLLDHVLKAYRPRRVLDLGTGNACWRSPRPRRARKFWPATSTRPRYGLRKIPAQRVSHRCGRSAPRLQRPIASRPVRPGAGEHLANPLRQLATPMARHLVPSALVILSGLLTPQAASVIAAIVRVGWSRCVICA